MEYKDVVVSFNTEQLERVDKFRGCIDRSLVIRWALEEYMKKYPSVCKNGGNNYGFR
jgi:metal-responsive CopG/Arc/MetJ family transcriptional regulator